MSVGEEGGVADNLSYMANNMSRENIQSFPRALLSYLSHSCTSCPHERRALYFSDPLSNFRCTFCADGYHATKIKQQKNKKKGGNDLARIHQLRTPIDNLPAARGQLSHNSFWNFILENRRRRKLDYRRRRRDGE